MLASLLPVVTGVEAEAEAIGGRRVGSRPGGGAAAAVADAPDSPYPTRKEASSPPPSAAKEWGAAADAAAGVLGLICFPPSPASSPPALRLRVATRRRFASATSLRADCRATMRSCKACGSSRRRRGSAEAEGCPSSLTASLSALALALLARCFPRCCCCCPLRVARRLESCAPSSLPPAEEEALEEARLLVALLRARPREEEEEPILSSLLSSKASS